MLGPARGRPMLKRAKVSILAAHGPEHRGQRYDPDNILAMLKPAFDGLQDCGLLADDRELEINIKVIDTDPIRGWIQMVFEPLP